jgi:hypothetical protein
MAAVYGSSATIAILLVAMIVMGSLDALFRFQDRGLRIIASLVVLGIFAWSFYHYLMTALWIHFSDADLALGVQRHFPMLGDRLASAVDFLNTSEDDPTAGSPILRRAVVAQISLEAEKLDFSKILDPRPTILAALLLLAMCLMAGILVTLDPASSRVAFVRLVNPFGNVTWPQATHLTLRREPPAIESLTLRLIPPAYTGQPPTVSERHIRALEGTKVQISGKASVPLQSAMLCTNDKILPARLSDDGRDFSIEFAVEKSGSYGFELTDREGLSGGGNDRWEIHAVADTPPTVNIENPPANLYVTSTAMVPLRIVARDDFALHRIAFIFVPSVKQPLAVSHDIYRQQEPPGQTTGPLLEGEKSDRRIVDYLWNLTPLALQPGMQVTFHAIAEDSQSRTGKSAPRSLTVVTPEEMQDRILASEKIIVAELNRALEIERNCRSQVESLRGRLAQRPPIRQSDVDRLQAVTHNQRDVDQILSSSGEGVPVHIAALLADLENNRIPSADIRRRMSLLSAELDHLGQKHLPVIDDTLNAVLKMAQVEREENSEHVSCTDATAPTLLATAAKHQDAVIDALAALIDQRARLDDDRRFAREIGRLLREQEGVARRAVEVGRRTLTQDLRNLPPKDLSDLNAVAEGQLDLARFFDRLVQEMDQAGAGLREHNPTAAQTVANALDQARRLAIGGQMNAAGRQMGRNQIGRAIAGQKQIDRDLRAVLSILAAPSKPSEADQSKSSASASPEKATLPKSNQTSDQSPGDKPSATRTPQSAGDNQPVKPVADAMHQMMGRFWGELPERDRQRMLQIPVEEFPPKYESMIEDYYRQLSNEEKR